MKILFFLLKSADYQVPSLLRPRGRHEAITKKIARIANPALCFLLQRNISLYLNAFAECMLCHNVAQQVSIDTFHSVVFIFCKYRRCDLSSPS